MAGLEERNEAVALARQAMLASPEALGQLVTIDGPSGPEPMGLWPKQREIIQSVLANRRTILLKSRQCGGSQVSYLLVLWWALAHPGTTCLIVSTTERASTEGMRRIRRMWDSLAPELRVGWDVESSVTKFQVKSRHGSSQIISLPSSSSAGRGYTVDVLIVDEAAYQPALPDTLGALLPTFADRPNGRILMLSTANGMGNVFHETYVGAEAGDNGWSPMFISAVDRPGRDDDWVEREREALGDLAAQELPRTPAEAFISSGSNVFPVDTLQEVLEQQCSKPPWAGRIDRDASGIHAIRDDNGPWRLWQPPQAGRRYLVAADICAGQGARDFAHVVIYDIDSTDQVGYLHGKPSPGVLAEELMKAGWLYRDTRTGRPALVAPEANAYGQATIATLTNDNYPNIYAHNRMERGDPEETRLLGFYTSQKSRALAIGALQSGLRERTLGVRDPDFIKEAMSFIINDNGKMEAGPGAHDDRVMAHAIASLIMQWSVVGDALRGNATDLATLPRASFYVNEPGHRGTRNKTGTVSYR